jgi:hypothetical protein
MVEGKQRFVRNRKYCIQCSPFGRHNTRPLDVPKRNTKECLGCGKTGDFVRRRFCQSCVYKKRTQTVRTKLVELVGNSCWLCGYNRCLNAIDFHHIDPRNKVYNIGIEKLTHLSWDVAISEMRKCVRLCSNCHKEVHSGIIDKEIINSVHERKWKEIDLK